MIVAKVVSEVISASEWLSDSLARGIVALKPIFQVQRAVNVAVVSLEVSWSLKDLFLTSWVLAGE